jgi:hypothetical protein
MDEVKVSGHKIAVPKGDTDEAFFGRILWFTMRACKVPHAKLRDKADDVGLGRNVLPSEMSPKDCFKNACKMTEDRRAFADGNNVEVFMVRSVGKDIRKLVREVQNLKGKKLQYTEVGEWEWDETNPKQIGPISSDFLVANDDPDRDELRDIWNDKNHEMRQHYKDNCECFRENQLRTCFTDRLRKSYRAVSIRQTGGVYFVPETYVENIKQWSELFDYMNKFNTSSGRSFISAVEVIKTEENRTMLKENLDDTGERALTDLLNRAGGIFKEKKEVNSKTYGALMKEFSNLQDSHEEHAKLLGEELTRSDAKMTQLRGLLTAMAAMVKSSGGGKK